MPLPETEMHAALHVASGYLWEDKTLVTLIDWIVKITLMRYFT